jgi:hypothetical protein
VKNHFREHRQKLFYEIHPNCNFENF